MEEIKFSKLSVALFRIMLSMIFLVAGFSHLLKTEKVVQRLEHAKLGYLATSFASAHVLVLLAGVGLLIGGTMLLAGFKTQWAAGLLILLIIPITVTIQFTNPEGLGPLFKNVGLLGGLVFFVYNGSMFYGIDQFLIKNKIRK